MAHKRRHMFDAEMSRKRVVRTVSSLQRQPLAASAIGGGDGKHVTGVAAAESEAHGSVKPTIPGQQGDVSYRNLGRLSTLSGFVQSKPSALTSKHSTSPSLIYYENKMEASGAGAGGGVSSANRLHKTNVVCLPSAPNASFSSATKSVSDAKFKFA